MRRATALFLLLGCGGTEPDGSATDVSGASGESAGSAASVTADESTAGETAATASDTTGDGDGDGDATDTGGEPGPTPIFDGAPGDALIPGWDPTQPRPIMAAQLGFGDAWTGATLTIHADGTVTSPADRIVIWEFEGLNQLYDGAHFGGSLPDWVPDLPDPVIALGSGAAQPEDWTTMTPGLWVDTDSGFVAPGTTVDRIVAWSLVDAAEPPTELYNGPWDGTFVFPDWDHDAPSPVVAWADTVVAGQWKLTGVPTFSDGSTEGFPGGGILVYGW